jgi:DNA repair protein RadC
MASSIPAAGVTIGDSGAAVSLFADALADLDHEALCCAYLGRDLRLLKVGRVDGMASAVNLPLRQVIGDALALDAWGLILAHNHPGGDPTPSAADRAATRRLTELARGLDLRVIDHLVYASDRVASFRALGLL